MVFSEFSLYKQNTKEPWGNVTCDSNVKGGPDKGIGYVYGPLKSKKYNDGRDSTVLQCFRCLLEQPQ